jgi:hypothetical protein
MAKAFQSAGMTLVVLLDEDVMINGQPFANEQAAYDHGFATGVATAAAMAPYGVKYFECGNEFTRKPSIIVDMGYAGTNASDFQNANWYGLRGVVRGMRDGIKSVTPDAKCWMNFTVNDIAAADMLWEGTQPDGSTGHPTFRWDVTSWHNYAPYGDIFNQGVDGAGPGYNIPSYCKARYGVPFMITEWNSDDVMIETDRAAYVTARLTEMYRHRNVDGLLSVMYYDLDSGNETYGIVLNGVPLQPTYGAFQAVVAANPDK